MWYDIIYICVILYFMSDGGRITVMKMRKTILSAASAVISTALLAASASAYITAPDSPESCVAYANQSWKITVNASYNVDYTTVGAIRFVTRVTDLDAYNADVESGFYAGTETSVLELQGAIALGANDWFQFDFSSIAPNAGDNDATASVTPYSDGTVELYGDLSGKNITNEAQAWTTMSINEWGNTSSEYSLTLLSAELFDKNGEFIVGFDANGKPLDASVTIQADEAAEEPEETTVDEEEAVEETVAEEEEVVEETAAEGEEAAQETTTTTATTTTAAETEEPAETTAAEATQSAQVASPVSRADSTSQNSSLMVILIVAGVVILGAIVGIIIVLARRKK